MIPKAFITEWSQQVPWQTSDQVEQDLVICRALVEIFSDSLLAEQLAFRGGTALHKLHLHPQPRFSEDIDLVQIHPGPIKEIIRGLQAALSFLGPSTVIPKKYGVQVISRFMSEIPPSIRLRLKVETNTYEHFSILDFEQPPFSVESTWFSNSCHLRTYRLEELAGTKLRALFQRKKGRDLFDLYVTLTKVPGLDLDAMLFCFREYMKFSVGAIPSQREFMMNLKTKMLDTNFTGDMTALVRPDFQYDPQIAFEMVHSKLVSRL